MNGNQFALSLLGGFSLVASSGIRVNISNQKACAIIAYLALNNRNAESRERLAGLLWGDRSEQHARASLRQSIKKIRKAFDDAEVGGFYASRREIRLDTSKIKVDLRVVRESLEAGRIARQIAEGACSPENILPGYDTLDSSFSTWLHVFRDTWIDGILNLLVPLLEKADLAAGEAAAKAILNADPTHEAAHRYLIRLYAVRGNTAAALDQYKLIWDLLDQDYGMEPDAKTIDLIAEVKSGSCLGIRPVAESEPATNQTNAAKAPTNGLTKKPTLMLAGLKTVGVSARNFDLADVFSQTLASYLTKFREWTIKRPLEGQPPHYPENGSYSLTGVLSDNDVDGTLKCIINLQDLSDGTLVWSEDLSVSSDNFLSHYGTIVRRIAIALNTHLSALRLATTNQNGNLPSHLSDYWLRGQAMIFRLNAENWAPAYQLFLKLAQEAPSFSPAFSSLAQLGNSAHIAIPGRFRSEALQKESLEFAKAAVDQDPLDSRAQLSLAWSHAFAEHYEHARLHFELAVDLNERDTWTLTSAAQGFAFLGEHGKASKVADQALEYTPSLSPAHWGYHMGIRFMTGEYESALEAATSAGDYLVNNGAWRAASHYYLGHIDDAKSELSNCFELIRENWAGDVTPNRENMTKWLLQLFPVCSTADQIRLRTALEAASGDVLLN